jgi:hypothetical protein
MNIFLEAYKIKSVLSVVHGHAVFKFLACLVCFVQKENNSVLRIRDLIRDPKSEKNISVNVTDQRHFGVDPDPDPQIHALTNGF